MIPRGVRATASRFGIALLGAAVFRFPFFAFQVAAASLQKKQIWTDHFAVPCISDCRVYGELADGIDATGVFRWTYFPVWPSVIRFFRDLFAPGASGYGAAVVISWPLGVLAGGLCLWLFDQVWPGDARRFGFSLRAWTGLFFLSIYPHGHFWFQGYSEPIFMIVLLAGLLAMAADRLALAGLLIGLSAAVRPQGVWLPPVWGMLLAFMAAKGRLPWRRALVAAAVSCFGVLGLLAWYWKGAGDPFYYYKIQANGGYGRTFDLLAGLWNHRPRWDSAVLYLYLSLAGSVALIRREALLAKAIGCFSLAFTEVPLFFGGFYSYVRFLSVSLALFAFLAEDARRSPLRERVVTAFFLTHLAIQVYKSGLHEWVG